MSTEWDVMRRDTMERGRVLKSLQFWKNEWVLGMFSVNGWCCLDQKSLYLNVCCYHSHLVLILDVWPSRSPGYASLLISSVSKFCYRAFRLESSGDGTLDLVFSCSVVYLLLLSIRSFSVCTVLYLDARSLYPAIPLANYILSLVPMRHSS
jgi:hypothetical protein